MHTQISRRTLLAGAGLLSAATAFGALSAPAAAQPEDPDSVLEAGGIRVYVNGTNIHVDDGEGIQRMRIHLVDLIGGVKARIGSVTLGESDGRPALLLDYDVTHDDGEDVSDYACTGSLTVGDGGFFDLVINATVPAGYSHEGLTQIQRSYTPFEAHQETMTIPVGSWATDDRGGIPYEVPLGNVYTTPVDEGVWVHELAARNNSSWVSNWNFHLPAERLDDTTLRMVYSGVIGDTTSAAAGSFLGNDTLRIGATTDQRFHMWEQDSAQLRFDLVTTNKAAPVDVTVDWAVRDWDGEIVQEGQQVLEDLDGIGTTSITLDEQVPRGLYFLAATASDGGEEAVTRLNLSVLPPWQNPIPAEESRFGMAALFADAGASYGVGRQDWLDLLQRFGVRHIRQVQMLTEEEAQEAGILRWAHRGPTQGQVREGGEYPEGEVNQELLQEQLTITIDGAEEANSPWLEWCNEWNMHGANIGAGTGMLTGASAPEYMHDVLKPMCDYIDERGVDTRLCIMGIAGPDYVWLERLAEEGGWEITEAVALHPGRGNFTPDFAPTAEEWNTGSEGNYWNYLGGIKKIRETIDELDAQYGTEHKLFLTEIYAPTYPNAWWTDSYRNSGENTLLSIALAHSERVDVFQWYQLNDGVHWNVDGINPEDKEFHYGLVMVDGSLKPSAVAFATSAEHFGGSEFIKQIVIEPETADGHGLLFEGVQGTFHVLWSRADGYVLHADHGNPPDGFYAQPEPWEDIWPTKTTVELPAEGDVVEIDCLGRETVLPNNGGTVSVTLDGAARIYYGLSQDAGSEPPTDPGEPDPTEDPTDEPDPTEDPTDEPDPTEDPTDEPTSRPTGAPTGDLGGPGDQDNGGDLPSTGIAGGLLGVAGALGATGAALVAHRAGAPAKEPAHLGHEDEDAPHTQ